jgi:hypothetical protein
VAAIVPAVAVNVAVVFPELTATVDGTLNPATLLDRATVAPPTLDTVAVQVEVAPDPRLVGVQANPISVTGGASEMVAVAVLPFRVAVMVAV